MDATTFLYLLSSLVQAFAALAGVVAVFLVLRYQELIRTRTETLREVGDLIQALFHYGAPGPLAEMFERQKICQTDFGVLPRANIDQRIEQAKKRLHNYEREHPEDYSKQKDGVAVFEVTLTKFLHVDRQVAGFRTYAIKSISPPLTLTIMFAAFLLINTVTDQARPSAIRLILSIVAFVAAVYGACSTITSVRSAFD